MYRNLASFTRSGVQYIWEATWDDEGNRVEIETPIEPYLFYEDSNIKESEAKYKSMFGRPLRKMTFQTNYERSKWIEGSKNIPLFEKLSPVKQYLLNKYYGLEQSENFTVHPFRIFNIDIEVEIDGKFPDPLYADYPINVISLYDTLTSNVIVWLYNKDIDAKFTKEHEETIAAEVKAQYDSNIKEVIFCCYNKEVQMLENFLTYWEHNYPDIITGWNINKFDILYIVNRIIKILGEGNQYRLSPVCSVISKSVYSTFEHNLNSLIYKIQGVSICDYLDLYKKFAGTSRQSFKLDYIANLELGFGKLDYYEMGYESMQEFMINNFNTFVKYNIIDTVLIKLMDDKLKFIGLMRNICNIGLVEYESIFRSIPYILGALVIQARKRNQYFLTDTNKSEDKKDENLGFEGAFVYPTKAGYYKNGIASFDFNSLYPNVMMTVNISPDTKVGKVVSNEEDADVTIRKSNGNLITISKAQYEEILKTKCTLSANKVLYIKPSIKQGIAPNFLDNMYQQRVATKNAMKENKKKVKALDEEIKALEKELEKYK
jgi:DNA polymerase elongation subunit (family B)